MGDTFLSGINTYLNIKQDGNSTEAPVCVSDINHYRFYQFSLIPAAILTIMFAATKQRRKRLLSVLDGRPGLIFPMDTLTRSSRISYCCAFGLTAFLVYTILLEQRFAVEYHGPIALKTLIAILSMFIYGMVFFPVFACLALATAFSYGLGTLYVWMFLIVDIYRLTECQYSSTGRIILLVRALPSLLCLFYLSISLPVRFVISCCRRELIVPSLGEEPFSETMEDIKESYQGKHVRKLLKKPEVEGPPVGAINQIKAALMEKVHDWIYHRQSGFRYPSRLMSVMFIAGCVVYVVTVELLVRFITIFNDLEKTVVETLDMFGLGKDEDDPDEDNFSLAFGMFIAEILQWSLYISISLACITSFLNILHMMSSFRTNLYALYRGDHSHIPPPSERSAASLCVGSIKYAGFQVAYIVWAYIISSLIFFIICLIMAVAILLLMEGVTDWLVNKVLQVWPSVVVALVLLLAQTQLAKYVFLQEGGQHLRLDNRRFYFIFTYFMFFYNIFLGLVSCLLRIIKAMMVGTIFLARLDNSTLPRKFEFFDPGFAAYQGYIHMEAAHTHPVVNVFIRLLVALSKQRKLQNEKSVEVEMTDIDDVKSPVMEKQNGVHSDSRKDRPVNVAARFNWLVTYTLLHNPAVRLYRKGFIQAMKKARKEGLRVPISDKPITDFDLVKTLEEREKERQEELQKLHPTQHGVSAGIVAITKGTSVQSNSSVKKDSKKKRPMLSWLKKKSVESEANQPLSGEEAGLHEEKSLGSDDINDTKKTLDESEDIEMRNQETLLLVEGDLSHIKV
ncbi:unnamed protein product [Lymnaea stagnalis]|uniref:Receptor for retinol uptake STRA6 n=1 Tax=Lymnaea stagnalis TaxID=6523 RepID=A0AAV2HAA5_LYMST